MPPPFDRHPTTGGSQRPSAPTFKRQANGSVGSDTADQQSPTDGRHGLVIDIEPDGREIVRAGRKPRHDRSQDATAVAPGGGRTEDGAMQHLGGRRRLRPERLLLIIGAVFVVAVLTKPWPTQPPTRLASPSPSHSQPSLMARVAPSESNVAPSATGTLRAGFADLCPAFGNRANDAPAGQQAMPGATPVWSKVDWGTLTATDRHSAWGFATTVGADGVPGTVDSTPNTNWVGAGAKPVYASVPLVCGQNVYAIAVTWPATVHVSRLSFVYLGEPESPPFLPPSGFVPNAPVKPLPARTVISAPTASNSGASGAAAGSARSGDFYIPPVDASSSAASKSTASAWQSHPWSWPYGAYQVTLTSDRGTIHIVLDLQLT